MSYYNMSNEELDELVNAYFPPEKKEFECKCGCGFNDVNEEFLRHLAYARSLVEIPFVVNSGCRCEKHNKSVGGTDDSAHIRGLAVDLMCRTSQSRLVLVKALLDAGFTRIGVYLGQSIVHADMDETRTPDVLWVRR